MKLYKETMEHLHFREDFCEATVQKAQNSEKKQRRLPRALPVAACICLCAVLLFGTAMATSPEFRSLFIRDNRVEETEEVLLPTDAATVIENRMEALTAKYCRVDGALSTGSGFGSVLPIERDGKTVLCRLTEDGTLEEALPSRTVKNEVTYDGNTYSLDMTIYSGDVPVAVVNGEYTPLADEARYTIWQKHPSGITGPLFVDLTTGEIRDPMANIDFTPPEGADDCYASAQAGGNTVLIDCHFGDGTVSYYYGNAETCAVKHLVDSQGSQNVFLRDGKIYSCIGEILCVMDESGALVPILGENERCSYDGSSGYAILKDDSSEDLTLVDVTTGDRLVLENCADIFTYSSTILENPAGTQLAIMSFRLTNGLYTESIAIVDPEKAEMVSLERIPGMKEEVCGWLDNDRFLIAGTLDGEWYLCVYDLG